jgi:hypothetical protein
VTLPGVKLICVQLESFVPIESHNGDCINTCFSAGYSLGVLGDVGSSICRCIVSAHELALMNPNSDSCSRILVP